MENIEGTIKVGGRTITNLRFSDDIDLAGSLDELEDMTGILEHATNEYGMKINAMKSNLLIASPVARNEGDTLYNIVHFDGEELEQVKHFNSL